jgi:hypothetical protein
MTTPLTEADNFVESVAAWKAWQARALLAQPSVAQLAPGGDVLERRSETGVPMSANAPEKCPITRRPFFMVISHPELGWVPTYGGPYDSYTIPHMEGKPNEPYHERELTCHHYDHDYGGWVDDESIPMRVINEGVLNALQSTQAPCPYEPHPSGICTKCGKAHAPTATQGQDAAPAEQPQDDEPTWQELEDFRKRHWTHWNAADNLLIAHLAQKLKCAARAKE